jgi:cobalt/nickel transport system permease protein
LSSELAPDQTPFDDGLTDSKAFLTRVDPRVKIIATLIWSILAASLENLAAAGLALGGALLALPFASWSFRNLAKRLSTINFFFLFMWLTLPFSFSTPGQALGAIGPLKVTLEGLTLAALLTLKGNAIVIAVIAVLGSSPLYVLAAASRSLRCPEKLVNLFLLAVRYLQIMFMEYARLRKAMRARGFKLNFSRNALNGAVFLIGSLLVRSFDRAERVHKAMISRGYKGVVWVRTDFTLQRRDFVFSLVSLFLLALIALGGFWWRII